MIDVHSHILPGLDDGPHGWEQSLEMARWYVSVGCSEIVATPHHIPGGRWSPSAAQVRVTAQELQQRFDSSGISVRLHIGMEVGLDANLPALLHAEEILLLGPTAHLLVEAPWHQFPHGWEALFYRLFQKTQGIILAHPERCLALRLDAGLVRALIDQGVFFQGNCGSFMGAYGKDVQKTAFSLFNRGCFHLLALDFHYRDFLVMRKDDFLGTLERSLGRDPFRELIDTNPRRLLNGESPQPLQVRRGYSAKMPTKRGLLLRFLFGSGRSFFSC
jgi:protein-tyrosine phosphatase